MLSYRRQLAKIGISAKAAVSYKEFYSRPKSLRQAMRSMDAPAPDDWELVSDIYRDDFWTDEVQGVAWNGSHWIFCCNANQDKPDHEDKALYVFAPGATFGDDGWETRIKYKDVPHPLSGTTESNDHWGQLTYYEGHLYISHWWEHLPNEDWGSVVVFKSSGPDLIFKDWIPLEWPRSRFSGRFSRAEFQGINPWDGKLYTCHGRPGPLQEFFIHDPEDGSYTGESIIFEIPYGNNIQGACFSPNGHLYIASDSRFQGNDHLHTIPYYSALNGYQFGVIPIDVEGVDTPELEGVCHASARWEDGRKAQIHTVVLENPEASLDNIYFKSLSTSKPELV